MGRTGLERPNTSIHLLEAFTAAVQVLPDPRIKNRLEELLILIRDTMTSDNGTLRLFFEKDWKPVNHADSSRAFILENSYFDHISFGHDIETAYLLIDASKTLYGQVDPNTLAIAKKLTDHTIAQGFAPGFYGIYDRGYLFDGKTEIISVKKTWWSQFEALHTLALMSQFFPEENKYTEGFAAMWRYIDQELTDHRNGGYYNNGLDTSPQDTTGRKAHNWKGPYHDGRALMMIWEYANPE
ncbi:MAG TPA: AGE family epimerase/isomerase [Prolixibacteraceae bacterium]|nr:AGE family epimerase/isomerase [Prolixibacteraceae bacterium]